MVLKIISLVLSCSALFINLFIVLPLLIINGKKIKKRQQCLNNYRKSQNKNINKGYEKYE